MTDIILATLIITAFVVFGLIAAGALLYIAVKIMMADEINKDYFLSDFYDREENSDSN